MQVWLPPRATEVTPPAIALNGVSAVTEVSARASWPYEFDPWHHSERSVAMKQECALTVGSPKLPIATLMAAEGTLGSVTYAAAGRVKADEGM